MCVHDRDLRRTSGKPGLVSTMDLAELNELDFSSWKNPWADLDDEAPDRDEELGKVLTLRKLLETAADYDGRVEVAIETKHPTRFGGLVEKRLVEMLRSFGWEVPGSPVRVMSFSFTALQRVERLAPDVQLVQLIDKAALWPMLRRTIGKDTIMGPGIAMLQEHPRVVESMSRRGPLHVWTVNTEAELDLCLRMGVQAVITDRPSYVLDLLDQRGEVAG